MSANLPVTPVGWNSPSSPSRAGQEPLKPTKRYSDLTYNPVPLELPEASQNPAQNGLRRIGKAVEF